MNIKCPLCNKCFTQLREKEFLYLYCNTCLIEDGYYQFHFTFKNSELESYVIKYDSYCDLYSSKEDNRTQINGQWYNIFLEINLHDINFLEKLKIKIENLKEFL